MHLWPLPDTRPANGAASGQHDVAVVWKLAAVAVALTVVVALVTALPRTPTRRLVDRG